MDRSPHWLRRMRPLLEPQRSLALPIAVLALAAIVLQAAIPTVLGESIDALRGAVVARDPTPLYRALAVLVGCGGLRSLSNFGVRYLLFRFTYGFEAALRKRVHAQLIGLPLATITRYRTGQLVSRAHNDIRTLQGFLVYLPYAVMVFGVFAVSIVYMFAVDARLALIAIAPLPVVLLCSWRLRKRVYPLGWLVQSRTADVASVVDENIRGQAAVKLFNQQAQQLRLVQQAGARLRWVINELIGCRARYAPWIENLAAIGQVAVLLYGGWLVIEQHIRLGQLVAFNFYLALMLMPLAIVGQVLVMGRNAAAAAARVLEILDASRPLEAARSGSGAPLQPRVIELDRVHYEAPPEPDRPAEGRRDILRDLSMTLTAGKFIALVGKTGSGKSALAHLLVGLATADSGALRIDGIDARDIDPARWHRSIVLVPQDSFLFADTLANNIRFGLPDATLEQVQRAAILACAHEFICAQPDGYQTPVGEGGVTLSGGQRQRITIAQALLMEPSVLVLDEATSALDSVTERRVIEALKRAMKGRTILAVSHRASLVRHADEVHLLHEGRIVRTGTHEQLLVHEPLYRAVFSSDGEALASPVREESDREFHRRMYEAVRGASGVVESTLGGAS